MERQYQTENIADLAAALAKAQAEIGHAAKDLENEAFKRGGKVSSYAGLPSVFDAARPALAKNGLSVVQIPDFDEAGNITLMTQLTHASGQWMRSWYPVRPVTATPQGLGSSLTYARRYAYSAMVGVAAADDDDDGNAAGGISLPPRNKGAVTTEQAVEIDVLIGEAGADKKKFLDTFKVDDVRKIPADQYSQAVALLKRKKELAEQKKPEAPNA